MILDSGSCGPQSDRDGNNVKPEERAAQQLRNASLVDLIWAQTDPKLYVALYRETVDVLSFSLDEGRRKRKDLAWYRAGFRGTWVQTATETGLTLWREAAIAIATVGLGSVANAARCGSMVGLAARTAQIGLIARDYYYGVTSIESGVQKLDEGKILGGIIDVTLGFIAIYGSFKSLGTFSGGACFVGDTYVLIPNPEQTCTVMVAGLGMPESPADVNRTRANLVVWAALATAAALSLADVAKDRRRKKTPKQARDRLFASGDNLLNEPDDATELLHPEVSADSSERLSDEIWAEDDDRGLWAEVPQLRLAAAGSSAVMTKPSVGPDVTPDGARARREPSHATVGLSDSANHRPAKTERPARQRLAADGTSAKTHRLAADGTSAKTRRWTKPILLALSLLMAGWLGMLLWPSGSAPNPEYASTTCSAPSDRWHTESAGVSAVLIQNIEVGQRVLAELPDGVDTEYDDGDMGREPDPDTWRRLKLRADKVDGTYAEVELLRPVSWLEDNAAAVGGTVEISVPECSIDGNALVLDIEPCPPIWPGRGNVVTGTFKHQSAEIIDVHVEGLEEPIGTTANHPFWSEDRQGFVRADELEPSERLRTINGTPQVTAIIPRSDPEPVYNLEVQYAHVYHVTSNGILVHNASTKRFC